MAPRPKDFGRLEYTPAPGQARDFGFKGPEPRRAGQSVDFGFRGPEPKRAGQSVDFGFRGPEPKRVGQSFGMVTSSRMAGANMASTGLGRSGAPRALSTAAEFPMACHNSNQQGGPGPYEPGDGRSFDLSAVYFAGRDWAHLAAATERTNRSCLRIPPSGINPWTWAEWPAAPADATRAERRSITNARLEQLLEWSHSPSPSGISRFNLAADPLWPGFRSEWEIFLREQLDPSLDVVTQALIDAGAIAVAPGASPPATEWRFHLASWLHSVTSAFVCVSGWDVDDLSANATIGFTGGYYTVPRGYFPPDYSRRRFFRSRIYPPPLTFELCPCGFTNVNFDGPTQDAIREAWEFSRRFANDASEYGPPGIAGLTHYLDWNLAYADGFTFWMDQVLPGACRMSYPGAVCDRIRSWADAIMNLDISVHIVALESDGTARYSYVSGVGPLPEPPPGFQTCAECP